MQSHEFAAGEYRPWPRNKIRQQSGFRAGQVDGRVARPGEHIASRIKADTSEEEIFRRSYRWWSAMAPDPQDPLYRLVQADHINRYGNTISGTGNAVVIHLRLFGIAYHQDRNF